MEFTTVASAPSSAVDPTYFAFFGFLIILTYIFGPWLYRAIRSRKDDKTP